MKALDDDNTGGLRRLIFVTGETWIMAVPLTASGPTQSVSLIIGDRTGLNAGSALFVDGDFDTYLSNLTDKGFGAVSIFNDTADGNTPPSSILTGPATGLDNPWGLTVIDPGDFGPAPYLCVVNRPGSAAANISIYPSLAGGNESPSRRIVGPKTQLLGPMALTYGPRVPGPAWPGLLYVTQEAAPRIVAFAVDATGDVAPDHILDGPATNLDDVRGKVAFDRDGNLYVANAHAGDADPAVLVFRAGATGNAAPLRTLSGVRTRLEKLHDIALDGAGNLYVLSQSPDETVHVLVFATGAAGNVAPVQRHRPADPGIRDLLDVRPGRIPYLKIAFREGHPWSGPAGATARPARWGSFGSCRMSKTRTRCWLRTGTSGSGATRTRRTTSSTTNSNHERYCYAELYGDDPFGAGWLLSITETLREFDGWGLGVSNIPDSYVLIFGDRLLVKGRLAGCGSASEVVESARRLLRRGEKRWWQFWR